MKLKLAIAILALLAFASRGHAQTVTYYYVVTAVDAINNESAYSNQAACPYDTTHHHCIFNWNASTSTVVGYNLYRTPVPAGGVYVKVNSAPITALTYTDAVPLPSAPSGLAPTLAP